MNCQTTIRFFFVVMFIMGTFQNVCGQSEGFTFVFLNKKSNAAQLSKEAGEKLMEGHMANIKRLAAENKLVAAGPFDGGGGMFILNTPSVSVVTEWVGTDPAVQAQRWDIEIYPYSPSVGSACRVQPPYEMVSYSFVRYRVDVTKSTVNSAGIFFSHDEYLKELKPQLSVIAEGFFGERDGGILILKEEATLASLEADPGVQQGLLELDIRKLWIAKGAFCEK